MPKLPHLSGREVIHVVMRSGSRGCVVPLHKTVKVGTLAGLLRQAQVDVREFLDRL